MSDAPSVTADEVARDAERDVLVKTLEEKGLSGLAYIVKVLCEENLSLKRICIRATNKANQRCIQLIRDQARVYLPGYILDKLVADIESGK